MIDAASRTKMVKEYYFSKKLDEIREMEKEGINVINLGIGSPDLAPSESTIRKLVSSAQNPGNHAYQSYRSIPELRSEIAAFYGRTYGVEINGVTQVLPLLGSKEGIMHISMAFLNPGDVVLVPNPGYPAYKAVAALIGAEVVEYDLLEENNWEPDLMGLSPEVLAKAKLMWVTYPSMPTGAKSSPMLFNRLVQFAKDNNILICNDNPYSLVLNDNPESLLSHDPEMEHVLELNSMSKSFNMAGWRIGMVLGHEQYINAIVRIKSNIDSGMFLPVQHAAIEALRNPVEWHQERNQVYQERRHFAIQILAELELSFDPNQVGLFLWAKVPNTVQNATNFVDDILQSAHVFITPGTIFGTNGDRFVRLSLCSSKQTFETALERIIESKKLKLAV